MDSAFKPTWRRGLFALGLAIVGFLLPQEVPLEWYPLNEPGTDINYLEIACASDKTGEVQIYYNLTHGFNALNSIRIPISPTTQTYTYTFPLPDGPITELRVNPPTGGGALNIRQMRIINRRGEEIRLFTRDQFRPQDEIAAISPSPEGWKLISTATATHPSTRVELTAPIIPVGKDHRNLLRCLLSTGYLSMMLWILLLAVLFTFYRPNLGPAERKPEALATGDVPNPNPATVEGTAVDRKSGWCDLFAHLGFMACLAVMFAFVGNRGLIRNSIRYARYQPPAVAAAVAGELRLEIDLRSSRSDTPAQFFWDTGNGIRETDSVRCTYLKHPDLQTIGFPLPHGTLKGMRFDPLDSESTLEIHEIRLVGAGWKTVAVLPLDSLQAFQQVSTLKADKGVLTIVTSPGAKDPILYFTAAAVERINAARQ